MKLIEHRFFRLEIALLLLSIIYMNASFVHYLGYTPHWALLAAAALLALLIAAKPRVMIYATALFFSIVGLNLAGWEVLREPVFTLAEILSVEIQAWEGIRDFPGPQTTLVLSLALVFFLTYAQLLLLNRGYHSWPTLFLGFTVYLWLWFQHYPVVEQDLIVFLSISLPALALLDLNKKNEATALSYRLSIIFLGILCGLIVYLLPLKTPFYYDEAFLYARTRLPALSTLQRTLEQGGTGSTVHEYAHPQGASSVGYSAGGYLGGGLTESTEPVMDLKRIEGNLPPSLYLRGHSSDYYTGYSWETRQSDTVEDLPTAFQHIVLYENSVELHIAYLQQQNDLFGLFPTTGIHLSGYDHHSDRYTVDEAGNIKYQGERFQGDYLISGKTISPVDFASKDPQPVLTATRLHLQQYLQLPQNLPSRIEELAREIVSDAETDREKASRIKEYLKQFPYQINTPAHPPEKDFVDQFLFELQEGYCAYYASAMVVLLRTLDIPARYVEGYRVPTENTAESERETGRHHDIIQVQQKHAHAWVEVFLEGYGWVAYEPTQPFEIRASFQEPAADDLPAGASLEDTREEQDGQNQEEDTVADPLHGPGEETGEEIDPGAARENQESSLDEEEDAALPAAGTGRPQEPQGEGQGETRGGENAPWKVLPREGWYLIAGGLLLLGAFFAAYYQFSRSKNLVELYRKIIRVRAGFHGPPGPGETPGQIVSQLQVELPELATDFERLKHCYQVYSYARSQNRAEPCPGDLEALPLKTVRLYAKKIPSTSFIKGLFKAFFKYR